MSDGGRMGRKLQIALLVSLGLNLFLVGFLAARWWAPFHHPPRWTPEEIGERLARPLPEKDAEVIRDAFQANAAKLATLFGALQEARREVRAKMSAEPLDRTALAAAMTQARMKRAALEDAVQEVILDASSHLSLDGRKRMWSPPKHP
jgi:uncharacterized membrane protein